MLEHLIVEEPYTVVRADKTVPCIIVQLRAFANRDQVKDLLNAGLAYYQIHNLPTRHWGWIANTRQMSAIPQEVQRWLADDWDARAYQAGLRELSIVASANILGRLATQQYTQQAVAQPERYVLEPMYYASLEEAKLQVAQAALNEES